MKQITSMILVITGLLLSLTAQAASFDCAKATTKVENLICADAELSKLDEELNTAYKTALQDKKQAGAIKQAQKLWMRERNNCVDVGCVKGAYEMRLSSLRPVTSAPVASSVVPDGCNAEDPRDKSNIRAQEIAGLYRQSVEGLPAYIGRPEEKLSGYNYLAITLLAENRIRVRLSTKEINGHDCGFDSEALLCGRTIRLVPNEEELKKLRELNLPAPYLNITQNQISFASIEHPQLYGWQRLYCGNMGSLNHSFKRSTRDLKINDAVFDQDENNTRQTRGAASVATLAGCTDEELRDNSNMHAQDIAGLYRQSVEGLPAYIGRPEEKLSGYNYLAITPLAENRIRVRLSTKEINGHDCGFDSEALLCGRTIRLVPNEEDRSALDRRKLPAPNLLVTANQIAFTPYANGSFVWGSPYCGSMGYLRQSFLRNTRKLKFDDSIFNQ